MHGSGYGAHRSQLSILACQLQVPPERVRAACSRDDGRCLRQGQHRSVAWAANAVGERLARTEEVPSSLGYFGLSLSCVSAA